LIDRYFREVNPDGKVYPNLTWSDQRMYNVDPLQKHTETAGEDENGKYISYYDKYDLKNKAAEWALDIGKDDKYIEYYDRVYYDEAPANEDEISDMEFYRKMLDDDKVNEDLSPEQKESYMKAVEEKKKQLDDMIKRKVTFKVRE